MRVSERSRYWLMVAWITLFGSLYALMVVRTKAPGLLFFLPSATAAPASQ